jgi:hypothetical protein
MALRWAMVKSQARTLLSGRRSGYARIAERNVSDQASSASARLSLARHMRSTAAPCSATTVSNGSIDCTPFQRSVDPRREVDRRNYGPCQRATE